ncbi:MAG: VCBS repeat-containing protein [Pyrinomonadaceae bacterium]|nr:VCBS repeat-containing protein [Pyrinomonadaceae bacterium]
MFGNQRKTKTASKGARVALVAALIVSVMSAALALALSNVDANPAAPANCTPPGVTAVNDPSGDQLPAVGSTKHDMQSISVAEPYFGAGVSKLVFTMKVADLQGTLPANTQWKVYFTAPNATNYWVSMLTDGNSAVSYKYGTSANSVDTTTGNLDAGSFTTDGTITLTVANSKVGNPTTGQSLTAIFGETYMLVGVLLNEMDGTSNGSYALIGNAACAVTSPSPTPTATPTPTPTPAPLPPGTPQYTNYYPPAGVAEEWGEPSIGANWISGKVMFFGGLSDYALRVTFNDSTSPAQVTWDQTPLVSDTAPRIIGGDPILVTDKDTGRTFVSQLQGLTPTATMDITDNDGASYTPSAGFGIGSGIDHQTIGAGPFHAPVPQGAVYQNAVYYCSQEGVQETGSGTGAANCALSVDGGLTFGPAVPVYAFTELNGCAPLHGHLKIAPDGTVYLPNKKCGNGAGMVVSEDNGVTWQVRTVPDSSSGDTDASVGIATDGTVFLGYEGADGHPRIAVSHDKGVTWINHTDVGAQLGLQNAVFPAVVAGDGGMDTARAAFAFYGSTSAGDQDSPDFRGTWYLYIASTFDGGKTWTTVNATPNDPMQRDGICTRGFQGCKVPRNLLDFFDATVDKEGRVLVGYEDGCMGACAQGGSNSNTEKGVIARQSGGKRMFAAYDPPDVNATPTPTPSPDISPTPSPTPNQPGVIPPAPQDSGPKVGYQNFEAPGTLVNVTSSSQGPAALTVEYLGHDAGEPSIGNNWKTGVTNFQSDLQTLFITFNDSNPNGTVASWVNRPSPASQFIDSDPIGFTDRQTGRVFAGELTLLSGDNKTAYSDDDGQTWVVSAFGQGIGSSVDHQTIGGGPFHAPLTRPTDVPGLYPNAVYYCSQLPQSACARSDDGGATFGPIVGVDPVADGHCGGLHGHVKVGPDGTVYLPFNNCNGKGAVIVSEDNGITWTIRNVQNANYTTVSASALQDPAVGIDSDGRVYFGMANGDGSAIVATSNDHGATWENIYDVGAAYGIKNTAYPAAVALDSGRAAIAFYGSTTPGDPQSPNFNGLWHLYITHTFDGGQHWTTTDATPGAPMQRGCIWMGGGANICRNLLDFFDMTVDKEGRVEVGYVNGCAGGNCAQAAPTAKGNAYTATATIARQSSGRRLASAFDPQTAVSKPGMPSVTTRRVGVVVHLGWSEADDGNSPITSYQILRGTACGAETLLATVPGNQTTYDDLTATDTTKTYYYKVVAVNGVGSSGSNNEVAAPYVGDSCSGMIVQRTPPGHPEQQLQGGAPASLAIDYIAVGEPTSTNDLMFKLKVSSLASIPANSRWRIVWNTYASSGQQFYVGMTTLDDATPVFEYGEIATGVVGLVVGVPIETKKGDALPTSNFNPDGTITIFVPKSVVGNPQPGDLLGAVNGRTFTGDNDQTRTLERSTLLIDHTFVKAQRDNGYPAATYTIAGNVSCSGPTTPPKPVSNDFDADGISDIAVWRPSEGNWYIFSSSTNSQTVRQWGGQGDQIVPADYDGDGKTDMAIFRPSEGNWYIINSSTGATTVKNWGQAGDKPLASDFDGDGKADIAVFRPSEGNWYIVNSGSNSLTVKGWGASDDKPVLGDFDGDGKTDIAVWRPSDGNWYILNSSDSSARTQQWGMDGDTPAPADYDGDGKTDVAIFRPSQGTWYIINSGGGAPTIRSWGDAGDKVIPSDYDGDGKADMAVWRPSDGNWYIITSSTDSTMLRNLGLSGDVPIPSAFIY